MSDLFATKFNYYHHSPSAVQKPTEVDMFQKILKARGEKLYYGSPATVGRAVEDYVSAVAIDGQSSDEALRHATSVLDGHELLPWDREADKGRLDVHRGDPLEVDDPAVLDAKFAADPDSEVVTWWKEVAVDACMLRGGHTRKRTSNSSILRRAAAHAKWRALWGFLRTPGPL